MTKRRLVGKAWRYLRNHGARETLARARNELRRRALARRHARTPQAQWPDAFDAAGWSAALADADVRLVIFDVFDTLLCRPLLDPDAIKALVARRLNRPQYAERRRAAEAEARRRAGARDVTLAEICRTYVELYGDADGDAATLQNEEQTVERALVRARKAFAGLPAQARMVGKRVVLASDMFLSEHEIRAMLLEAGITAFDRLYVSSECGARKESGELYRQILAEEGVPPAAAVMLGDNPVSDQSVPKGLGLRVLAVENPIARLAHAPRLQALCQRANDSGDLDSHLWAGLIVQQAMGAPRPLPVLDAASLTQGGREGMGYAVVGPLLVAFCQWLHETARAHGIERLYFLAREGQLMQAVFAALYPDDALTANARYLVLSRRAISVAMIESIDDIEAIARAQYAPNALETLLYRRFGLRLNEARIAALRREGHWPRARNVTIADGNIDAIRPALHALAPEILARARAERAPMLAYLHEIGLAGDDTRPAALVDVGYSGSIQDRLCTLLARPVHGLYMLTRDGAAQVRDRHAVKLHGCYAENLRAPSDHPLNLYNVPMEMLMGSDDAQIRHYVQDADGRCVPNFQELSAQEQESAPLRQQLRAGALAFAHDWRALLERGLAQRLHRRDAVAFFTQFWEKLSPHERAEIATIATDDYYCGMGIVRFDTFFP